MEHSLAVTQIVLICSLTANGFWIGNHLVSWGRSHRPHLRKVILSLLALGAILSYVYVFVPLPFEAHMLVLAVSIINNAVLIKCFNEWVRILPRPWGQGEARDG